MIEDGVMYMIIDTSVLGRFGGKQKIEDREPIIQWMDKGGKTIYSLGNKFDSEVSSDAKNSLIERTNVVMQSNGALCAEVRRYAADWQTSFFARDVCESAPFGNCEPR